MQTPKDGQSIDDVVDFYHKWPDLRQRVLALIDRDRNLAEDKELLNWMVQIIDRIGPNDLRQDR